MGGRPLQTTLDAKKRARIHERLTELLTTVQKKVFGSVAPGKIVELYRLGAGDAGVPGISTDKVVAGFFSFLGFPRLHAADVVRTAIARGVETGLFACTTGRPPLGDDGRYRLDRGRIAFERTVAEDEIDLDSGFLIAPAALPAPAAAVVPAPGGDAEDDDFHRSKHGGADLTRERKDAAEDVKPPTAGSRDLTISFSADRNELYNAWNALANLADAAGKISVRVQATSDTGFDRAKLENGVLEPLRELGLIDDEQT